jgi:hypothetical protein
MIKHIAIALFIAASAAGPAVAQPQTQPSAPATAAAARADVKAAKGVENREPVEEGSTFAKGDTVYAWSRIFGANGTKVTHVWKLDGKDVWKAYLRVGSNRWTTNSRRKISKPGNYTVDVVAADGTSLGSVSFTVQ